MYSRLLVRLVSRQSLDDDSHELDTDDSSPIDADPDVGMVGLWNHRSSGQFNSEFMQYFELLCLKL